MKIGGRRTDAVLMYLYQDHKPRESSISIKLARRDDTVPNQDIEELLDKYEKDIKDDIVEGSARDRMIGVLKRHGRDV